MFYLDRLLISCCKQLWSLDVESQAINRLGRSTDVKNFDRTPRIMHEVI